MLGFKPTDYRTVSRIHFDELGNYLSDDTTKGPIACLIVILHS